MTKLTLRHLLPASILAVSALTAATAQAQTALNMGSVPTGTGWFFGISEGARVISANTPYEITVRETGGTRENAIRLTNGELDLAFTEALVGYEQYNGEGRFADMPNPNVRLVYWIAPSTMHWAVRQDSGLETFEDLNPPYSRGWPENEDGEWFSRVESNCSWQNTIQEDHSPWVKAYPPGRPPATALSVSS